MFLERIEEQETAFDGVEVSTLFGNKPKVEIPVFGHQSNVANIIPTGWISRCGRTEDWEEP
jgi:hypothetical protein